MQPLNNKQKIGGTLVIIAIIAFIAWNRSTARPDIRGHWMSQKCEEFSSSPNQVAHIQRDMTLTGGEWNMIVTFFLDSNCSNKAMGIEIHGPYELGDASSEVTDATHGQFDIRSIKLTPYTPDTAQVFEQSACGQGQWEVGQAKEVGDTGCLNVVAKIRDCPAEYDLVKRSADNLYFGDRSQSLCKRGTWPQALGRDALIKTK